MPRPFFFFFFKFIFIFERERGREGGREGGREKENAHKLVWGRKRERIPIPSRLHAVSAEPNVGLELMDCEIMT